MRIIGLRLPLVKPGDDLVELILCAAKRVGGLKEGDIVVIASSVLATAQGRLRRLGEIKPSKRARELAKRAKLEPEFVELVLREADRVLGVVEGAVLTVKEGVPCANAGVDSSNAPRGYALLAPLNPNQAARGILEGLKRRAGLRLGVVVADSHVQPLRRGTVGLAVGVAGVRPVVDCRGKLDLFGRPLRVTFRALADQLATAAQLVMGEAAERVPVAVVRGVGGALGRGKLSPKLPPEQCMYFGVLQQSGEKGRGKQG